MSIFNEEFVLNPNIVFEERDSCSFLINKTQNLRKECSRAQRELIILLKGRNSFTIDSLTSTLNLSDSVISYLLNYSIIIPKECVDIFSRGVNYYTSEVMNDRQASISSLLYKEDRTAVLFGVPFDMPKHAYFSSVQAPNEIRKRINTSPLPFSDIGNISYFPHVESLESVGTRLDFLLTLCKGKHCFPVFLGGDHSISMYTVNAVLRNSSTIGIIHFDAHHDLYYDPDSLNHLNHANVFFHLAQQENVKSVTQIGVRTPSPIFTSNKIKTIMCGDSKVERISKVLGTLPKNIDYYLSFDVDVLDPSIAPDVVAPIPNGLTLQESKNILNLVFKELNIVAMDFVEACTPHQKKNKTIDAAVELISHCIKCKNEKGNQ